MSSLLLRVPSGHSITGKSSLHGLSAVVSLEPVYMVKGHLGLLAQATAGMTAFLGGTRERIYSSGAPNTTEHPKMVSMDLKMAFGLVF